MPMLAPISICPSSNHHSSIESGNEASALPQCSSGDEPKYPVNSKFYMYIHCICACTYVPVYRLCMTGDS